MSQLCFLESSYDGLEITLILHFLFQVLILEQGQQTFPIDGQAVNI